MTSDTSGMMMFFRQRRGRGRFLFLALQHPTQELALGLPFASHLPSRFERAQFDSSLLNTRRGRNHSFAFPVPSRTILNSEVVG
jgi:hypothetical protein